MFWLGYQDGAFGLTPRASFGIAVWWTIVVGVVIGLWPLVRPNRAAVVTGGLLAGFAALAGASMVWAASAEQAFLEFERSVMYVGVYALAVVAGKFRHARHWSDGMAIGIVGIALVAFSSRCFSGLFEEGELPRLLPDAGTRLSFPVNYWNGLGILVALSSPLLLRAGVAERRPSARGLALAPLPLIAAVVYLSSSRTGAVVLLLGTIVFICLTDRRWAAATAAAIATCSSIAGIAFVNSQDALVNGPLEGEAAAEQGRYAALAVAIVCFATGLAYALAVRHFGHRIRVARRAGRAAAAAAVLAGIAAMLAADPVQRFEDFRQPPVVSAESDDINTHLLSASGNWRWQYWQSSLDQFEARPWLGDGAGSFESWWAQHGARVGFVRDAHSLYFEVLGELGAVGFVLLVTAFGVGLAVGIGRARRAPGDARSTAAALAASFAAYSFAVGLDWIWELTVVSVIGIVCLGLITGPATAGMRSAERGGRKGLPRSARLAIAAVGVTAVAVQALPLVGDIRMRDSQDAARRGDTVRAVQAALDARRMQPWASSPYLQLALLDEEAGRLRDARAWILGAIERDSRNWRLWLVAARIETSLGDIYSARHSLARAKELNPRTQLVPRS
jgi:hypothetical protein